jgi:type I restriction enzyme M protein
MDRLTPQQKKIITDRIRLLDPKSEIVTIEPNDAYTGGKIVYIPGSGIAFGEASYRLTDEEYVRAYLTVRLCKELRYPANALELEKTYTIGRPSPTKAQIDIKVWDRRDRKAKTFMLIEAKRPDDFDSYQKLIEDQLFKTGNQEFASGISYIVWYSVEFQGDDLHDKCIVIDIRKFDNYKDWVEAGELGHNLELPIEYGTVRKRKYVKGDEEHDLRKDVTRSEFEKLRRDFHNVLWGGAKMGDTDVFNNLLRMFLAKIYDELTTDEGKPYRFQTELKDDQPETAAEIVSKVNLIYQARSATCVPTTQTLHGRR